MITYFDTSTIVKLLVDEDGSDEAAMVWHRSDELASGALVVVEARAALAAATRASRISSDQHATAKRDLADLVARLAIVEISRGLIDDAAQLAEDEGLRGYDAVHLAAAMSIEADIMTSADDSLCDASSRRGLHVVNPLRP